MIFGISNVFNSEIYIDSPCKSKCARNASELWEEEQIYWSSLLKSEDSSPINPLNYDDIKSNKNEIFDLRSSIIDSMFEISHKLGLEVYTTQMAMVYLDKLIFNLNDYTQPDQMDSKSYQEDKFEFSKIKKHLHLWATTLLLIACKFNEVDTDVPYIDDFIKASNRHKYSYNSIVR